MRVVARGEVRNGSGGQRITDEVVPVSLGHDRNEQLAGANLARIERHTIDLDVGPQQTGVITVQVAGREGRHEFGGRETHAETVQQKGRPPLAAGPS
jgi:hypothetical protein